MQELTWRVAKTIKASDARLHRIAINTTKEESRGAEHVWFLTCADFLPQPAYRDHGRLGHVRFFARCLVVALTWIL